MDVIEARNDDRFRLVVEFNPVAMLMVNGSGSIALANVAAERLLGYDPGTLIGQSVDILVPASARHHHHIFRAD